MRTARFLLFVYAAWTAVGSAFAEEYKINLDRPEKVGSRFNVSLRSETKLFIKVVKGEKPLPPGVAELAKRDPTIHTILIELDGSVEILRVDKAGRVLKKAVTVRRWKLDDEDDGPDFNPTSNVIIAETVDGKTQFTINGAQVGLYHSELLNFLITTYTGGFTVNANFGTKKPSKVGATWPVKIDDALANGVLAKILPDAVVRKQKVKGVVKLTKVERIGGTKCLRVDATLQGPDSLEIDVSGVKLRFKKKRNRVFIFCPVSG